MSLRVIRSGILDSLQDVGRHGYGKWGINPGGAMDAFAAQTANAIVGNRLKEAVIEMHFPAGTFCFEKDTLICLTGADFSATIDSVSVPPWKAVIVKKNAVLTFKSKGQGNRCYLAVQGGFWVPKWLGSASTNLKINAGGLKGTPLKKDDVLSFGASEVQMTTGDSIRVLPWKVNTHVVYQQPERISFIPGNEWNTLTTTSQQRILSQPFSISPASDRMGYYLDQKPLGLQMKGELLSSAVSFGTMQLLPEGKVLVLMADHQTTGGYPRIGHVASAHLPKLAQLGAGEKIYFDKISLLDAEKMVFSLHQGLRIIQQACLYKLHQYHADH